jgi:predicted nuclease of predicted toxin-antitoxin system
MRLRFLIDECLTPDLAATARAAGMEAAHLVHLGCAGLPDWNVLKLSLDGDYTLVTNNARDFIKLYRRIEIHNGLIVLLPAVSGGRQVELFGHVLEAIRPRDDLVNCIVVVDASGQVVIETWPPQALTPADSGR